MLGGRRRAAQAKAEAEEVDGMGGDVAAVSARRRGEHVHEDGDKHGAAKATPRWWAPWAGGGGGEAAVEAAVEMAGSEDQEADDL